MKTDEKFALMLKKEQGAEEKRKAQGITYPTEQKVITPKTGAANAAPTIVWKQDGNLNFKSGNSKVDKQTVITAMEAVYDEPDYVNISISGDRVSGDMYAAIDGAVNSAYYGYLQKIGGSPFGMAVGAVNHYSNDYNDALYEAKARGATDEEAIRYARAIG